MSQTLLEAREVRIAYGATPAVNSLSLAVERGEVVGLIGPDGAGKTSTLRVFAGLQRACSGSVRVFGCDAWAERRKLFHRLGYLAQRFALYGDLTVDENLQFFALLLGVRHWRSRRDLLLGRVGLLPFRARLADQLSGGMKQKLALVCSILHEPEVLFFDEPSTGIDPVSRRELWKLLGELVAEGLTLVVATPYLDEAERCTRVVLMHRGRVLANAAPTVIRGLLPGTVLEVHAEPRDAAAAVLRESGSVLDVQPFAAGLHVRVAAGSGEEELVRGILAARHITVHSLGAISPTLEDAFLYLMRTARTEEAA